MVAAVMTKIVIRVMMYIITMIFHLRVRTRSTAARIRSALPSGCNKAPKPSRDLNRPQPFMSPDGSARRLCRENKYLFSLTPFRTSPTRIRQEMHFKSRFRQSIL